ncbi:hypothetical protein [Oligoflexus tunisiensis]|uniref:hypothetical protein n=1 Tax=Oligoflexus tunisiensis TaxID=708132 RepID=UPI00114D2F60|nr:hypothetical protein [Oligoflexus tunisiensis]
MAKAAKTAKKDKKPYRLIKKRSGRYAIMQRGKYVHGEDKVKILVAEGLIKLPRPKAKAE